MVLSENEVAILQCCNRRRTLKMKSFPTSTFTASGNTQNVHKTVKNTSVHFQLNLMFFNLKY